MAKVKRPNRSAKPGAGPKTPRTGGLAASLSGLQFRWEPDTHDLDGPFGWRNVSAEQLLGRIIPRLKALEGMNWSQVTGSGSHEIDVDQLCKAARDRLEETGRGDLETVFSVRVTGPERVFGFKDGAILRLLWWDPDHRVCPARLRHT